MKNMEIRTANYSQYNKNDPLITKGLFVLAYRCLSVISGIDEKRMEKLYPKMQELFYRKRTKAKTLDDLYYLFYWLESSSKKEAKKLLQKTTVEDIAKLISLETDSEAIAGMVEVIGKISKEKAIRLLDQIKAFAINHAEKAEEPGDITDVLEIMTDINKEKAEELLDEISIEFIARRVLEIDHLNQLGSIAHILSIITHISKNAAEDLLSKIGIEIIKEKIQKSQNYYPGVIKILEVINDISQDKVRYLITDIDVNHLIDQTRNIYDSTWLLELQKKLFNK
jgi:hypothetical protein